MILAAYSRNFFTAGDALSMEGTAAPSVMTRGGSSGSITTSHCRPFVMREFVTVIPSPFSMRDIAEKVSMVDFASGAFGKPTPLPVYLDDEGIEATDAVLIDRGMLVGYMNNRESAAHFGQKPCGNARAYSFSDEPLIRMRNTAILPGTDKLEDMIAATEHGYYLIDTNNGQADTTGEFMFGVCMGYEIVNGKLGRALLDTTISGVAFEMLKTVDMVSDEVSWSSAGVCGKKQPMPVGLGGPDLKCLVSIGGR